MKTINKIFIFVFLTLIVYIARADINTAFNRSVLYVASHIGAEKVIESDNNTKKETVVIHQDSPKVTTNKKVQTSTPLKVLSDLVNKDNGAKLTKNGVITITNKQRFLNGELGPLKENFKLDLSAEKKLKDMFTNQYFEHQSPTGVGVADLAKDESYDYIVIGENLALGDFKDDSALVDAWMASPGHRANILNKHYSEIGVAVGHGIYEKRDVWIAVQHFGLAKDVCPSIDGVLGGSIAIQKSNAKIMEDDMKVRKDNIDSGAVYEGMTTNEQIAKYNELVKTYNDLVASIKQNIVVYNDEVNAFNACIAKNTL